MSTAAFRIRTIAAALGVMTVAIACEEFLVDSVSLDDTPPTFTGVAFSPDTVDISAGPQPVQVDIGARDDSGIDSLTILVKSPTELNQTECLADTPSTGTAQDGEWRCELMLETGWEIGAWSVQAVSLFDAAGNALALTITDLLDAGYAPRFEVVAPTAEADLSLTKVGSADSVFVDELVQYVLTVSNNGPSIATGVTVIDTIPVAATPGSMNPSQGSCGLNGAVVTCDLGVVAIGDTAIITLNVSPTAQGILTNTAYVASDLPDGNPGNNTASASTQVDLIPPADLAVTLVVQPDPVRAGDNITHDINVSNPGPGDITDLTIQLAIDGAVLLVTTPAACTTSTQTSPPRTSLSCVIASLGSGQASALSVVVSAVTPGDTLTSTATIESWTGPADPNSANNAASDTTVISRLVAWTNASGGTWSDPGNWTSGSVPTVSDSVEIALAGTYSVTLDTDATVGHVALGGSGTSGAQRLVIGAQTLTVDSLLVVRDRGVLELSGGVLTGTGNVSIASAMDWTAGAMEGTGTTVVENGAQLNMSGTAAKSLDTRTVDVAGTALWTDGTIRAGNASFNILGTGVFDVQSDDLFEWTTGQPRPDVNITGSLVRAGNAGIASFTTRVNNNGTVDIQTGTLLLGGNSDGTSDGSFIVSLGARLDFSGNAVHTLAVGSSVTGPGDVYVTGGNVSAAGSYNIAGSTDVSSGSISFDSPGGALTATATISGGVVTGAGSLTIGSVVFWTGGSATLQGQLRVPAGALAALRTPATKSLGGGGLWIAGNVQWTEGNLSVDDGVIDIQPSGVFNIFGDVSILDASPATVTPELQNSGTVIRRITGSSLPTDSATVEIAVTNTGVIDVQQNGTLTLRGDFTHADQAVLQGRGTIDLQAANVVAFDGDVNPGTSPGALTLLGAFSPSASSTVNIELGGTAVGTEYDQLNISGPATLDGELSVTLVNGFTPAEADTFTVLRYGSRASTFASATGLDLGGGLTLQPAYTDTALYLIAQIPPPPPLSLTGTILFSSDRDGSLDIYAKDLTTGVVTQLTNNVFTESSPSWSPNGSQIALTRNNNVWVMDADGSNLVQLTTSGTAGAPSWSPDGAEIVYQEASDGDWDIWALEVANPTNTRIVTNTTLADQFPRFSPDGSQIVFTRGQDSVLVVDADGSNEMTLRVGTVRYPVWSPDGTQIAFSQFVGGWQIMALRLADMTVQQITNEAAYHWYPEWSPDGSVIMFSKNALNPDFFTDVFGLWAIRSDGSGAQVLVEASAADDFNTSWRP